MTRIMENGLAVASSNVAI